MKILREKGQYADSRTQSGSISRFYQVEVENCHQSRLALNCYAYIEGIFDKTNNKEIPIEIVELKWAGYVWPNVMIAPRKSR